MATIHYINPSKYIIYDDEWMCDYKLDIVLSDEQKAEVISQYNLPNDGRYLEEQLGNDMDKIEEIVNKYNLSPEESTYVTELMDYEKRQRIIKDYNMVKGDIVAIEKDVYRNEGKNIYDGVDIVRLYSEEDDYGSVPKSLVIGKRFDPRHWINVIDHNTIIWIDATDMKSPNYIDTIGGQYEILVDEINGFTEEYMKLYNSGARIPVGVDPNIGTNKMYYPWTYVHNFADINS